MSKNQFNYKVQPAWKVGPGSAGSSSWRKPALVAAALGVLSLFGWLGAPVALDALASAKDAAAAWAKERREPALLAESSDRASSCLSGSLSVAGGPGWDKRSEAQGGGCLTEAGWHQLKTGIEASGLGKELDRPGSALRFEAESASAERASSGLIRVKGSAIIELASEGRMAKSSVKFGATLSGEGKASLVDAVALEPAAAQ